LILTFVQVWADGTNPDQFEKESSALYFDAASLPEVECHALRHLYFLLHTDEDFAESEGLEKFWKFAHKAVDIHHPAVAGLIKSPNHI